MRQLLTLLFLGWCLQGQAQTTATFEDFNIGVDSFLNGSDLNGGFSTADIFLPNSYNPQWNSWSGWAISSMRDTTTPGFTNGFSAITGGGYDGSTTYATSYVSGESQIKLTGNAAGKVVGGVYITNATYTYLSMRDGDGFAKKFGGATGDDPDFLLLTIKKYENGVLSTDSVHVYLADYRFTDNTQDYILSDWTYVDLTSLGNVDSLSFSMTSSDVGSFGMNTPAYFCIDHFETTGLGVSTPKVVSPSFTLAPNPTTDLLTVKGLQAGENEVFITDMMGRIVWSSILYNAAPVQPIDISHLPYGMYLVKIGQNVQKIIKQ